MPKPLRDVYVLVRDRPAPGFTKQRAASIVTSSIGIAVTLGVLPVANSDKVLSWGNIAISVLFVLWGAVHTIIALLATRHTTPTIDPRDDNGKSLVPAASSAAVTPIPDVPEPLPIVEGDPYPPAATDPSLLPDQIEVGGLD